MTTTVGFVCEGPTDVEVLRPLVEHVAGGPIEPVYLQPSYDALDQWGQGGETRVERWCKDKGSWLQWLLQPRGIDLLVIQMDADRCPKYGAADTTALCATIKGWLGDGARLPEVLIVLPAQATEAWLVAAYQSPTPELEALRHPEDRLAQLGKLARGAEGRPLKAVERYAPMTADLISKLPELRPQAGQRPPLIELHRFMTKLERHPALAQEAP